jgi:glyoxylase-like metal-dependent hydrolase (beta-lactamase superfamily II)
MEIIPQVHQLETRGTNVFLLVEEKLTLVDTGYWGSTKRIVNFVQQLGCSLTDINLIIITHHHLDHTGSLAELKALTGAKVAAHKDDAPIIQGKPLTLPSPPQAGLLPRLGARFLSIGRAKAAEVDILLEDGQELSPLGGMRVIHTPGHTPGSISLFFPQRRLLMVGDALNHRRRLSLPPRLYSVDMARARQSVKRLAELQFDILCFGHGPAITEGAAARVQDLINRSKLV